MNMIMLDVVQGDIWGQCPLRYEKDYMKKSKGVVVLPIVPITTTAFSLCPQDSICCDFAQSLQQNGAKLVINLV